MKIYIQVCLLLIWLVAFITCQTPCVTSDNHQGQCTYAQQCSTTYNPYQYQQNPYSPYGCSSDYNGYPMICCPSYVPTMSSYNAPPRYYPQNPSYQTQVPFGFQYPTQRSAPTTNPFNGLPPFQNQNPNFVPQVSPVWTNPYTQPSLPPTPNSINGPNLPADRSQLNRSPQFSSENVPPPKTPGKLLPTPGVCGLQAAFRIVGGEKALINEYPWMVLIEHQTPRGNKDYHCGGSLINKNYVLTAAHCLKHHNIIDWGWTITGVTLGEWDTRTDPDHDDDSDGDKRLESDRVERIPVINQIVHKQYNPYSNVSQNDIALLRLEYSVNYTDWITPICLPQNEKANKNYDGEMFEISGWGQREDGRRSPVKMRADIDGISFEQCKQTYHEVTNNQICAGGTSKTDSCNGDSGGPLMSSERAVVNGIVVDYRYVVGVISYGPKDCGQLTMPAVHTRVDKFMDWIRSNIEA